MRIIIIVSQQEIRTRTREEIILGGRDTYQVLGKPHPKLVSSGCGRERVVVDDRRDGLELVTVPLFDDPVLGHPDLGREGERLRRLLDNLELATKPGLSVSPERKISPQKIG